ncbi:type-F conjugative transfer system mating-pair stabilization protein TraN [Xenorhabdus sp. XENO-1]|nr:type-F conjugative transfer system mating-pair stabilization protein TraN [Xenorhabdus bovienii]MCP9269149.1 type-F conjugative transfer system mating-pair stabilization protein TraN [Xenorhabdus bovienii subsp. africana]
MRTVANVHVAILFIFIGGMNCSYAANNDEYRKGSDFAKQIQGQGENALKNFNFENELPNYKNDPQEKKYYGGVDSGGDGGLKNAGANDWASSDVGKAVSDSILNNPKETISMDAPFIKAGKDVEANAEKIVGNVGQQCQAQEINRSEFTNYTCERDVEVLKACTREAEIGGYYKTKIENQSFRISTHKMALAVHESKSNPWFASSNIKGTFTIPFSGDISQLSFHHVVDPNAFNKGYPFSWKITLLGLTAHYGTWQAGERILGGRGITVKKGQQVDVKIVVYVQNAGSNGDEWAQDWLLGSMTHSSDPFYLDMSGTTEVQEWVPTTSIKSECPLAKEAGAVRINTKCIEPGGNRDIVVDGKNHQVHASCWRFEDTYRTQDPDQGTCTTYVNNPACTLITRQCAFKSEDGVCLHENATYSCETRTAGKIMICGGEMFCLDGECDKVKNQNNQDFQKAVSELAAVAAAAKDVAALNGINVRAFTGKATYCTKKAVGFSDCCKNSGWGKSIGLASCNSEEKALGKAKEDKLTVSIGEFCAEKVLGVCLRKKRSYCQFDSKLAQIVQQQGRSWQLGIGFGGAKSPDCRGITVEELQQVKFDHLDFSNFYEDLMNNKKIPNNDVLMKKTQEQIGEHLKKIKN